MQKHFLKEYQCSETHMHTSGFRTLTVYGYKQDTRISQKQVFYFWPKLDGKMQNHFYSEFKHRQEPWRVELGVVRDFFFKESILGSISRLDSRKGTPHQCIRAVLTVCLRMFSIMRTKYTGVGAMARTFQISLRQPASQWLQASVMTGCQAKTYQQMFGIAWYLGK